MSKKKKETIVSVEVPVVQEVPVESVDPTVETAQEGTPKKKRIRRKQSVKLHNKKLSVAVICANPYIRQFS